MSYARLYLRMLGQLGSEWPLATFLVIANLAIAGAQFAEPVLFGRIIDQLAKAQSANRAPSWDELLPFVLAWAGFGIFLIIASLVVALLADRLSHRRRLMVVAHYFDHLLHLPLGFHTNQHSGLLMKVMLEGAGGMAGLWLSFFRENCASLVALVILLPFSLFLNWRLGLLLVLLVVIFAVVTLAVIRRTDALQRTVESYNTDFAERAADALGNVAVIQSFARIETESQSMRQITGKVLSAQMPVLSWWAVANVTSRASATLALVSIFVLGIWLNMQGLASIGEIVTFMNFAAMLIARLEQAVGFINYLFQQAPKLRDFFAILDTTPSVPDHPKIGDPGRLQGVVRFENVDFSYDERRQAVKNVSFSAHPGETLAFVGATGSGKSTTLSLLHRVYDPTSGRITIDDIDIRDLPLASLRRNIGVVFQEPMLFARSIDENLRVGKPDASEQEIDLALERAQAKEFIARQSDGLNTIVGERGRTLSGGERQRISIARALLKDPPIMIFDEATSALDANTEKKLQSALEAATVGRTTFVIAHRLATIRSATRILLFEAGEIVESGSFEELLALKGRFAALAHAQFMGNDQ